MALIKPSEPWAMTAEQAALRPGYAARSELDLRTALEALCRARWSDARVVHEIVMGEGRVRADVAAIAPAHIAAFEVKGSSDDTVRLLHQVGMYQLCVPEVWMVVSDARCHADDAKLIRHLLPSVGLLVGRNLARRGYLRDEQQPTVLDVEAEAVPREPVWRCALEMLWAAELASTCDRLRIAVPPRATRPKMIAAILDACSPGEIQSAICTALRARDAKWRADPAVT